MAGPSLPTWTSALLLVGLLLPGAPRAAAAEPSDGRAARKPVARAVSVEGPLFRKAAGRDRWRVVNKGDQLYPGDLVVGVDGKAVSRNGAVELAFRYDPDGLSPVPAGPAGVVLRDDPKADLKFALDQGRLTLTNRKTKGPAVVSITFRKEVWNITLPNPGDEVGVELLAHWVPGTRINRLKPGELPTADVIFLVVKGQAEMDTPGEDFTLKESPGPALYAWSSASGGDTGPQQLEKMPAWATDRAGSTPRGKVVRAAVRRFHDRVVKTSLKDALAESLASDDLLDRKVAAVVLATTDDLDGLADVFREAKHWEVMDGCIRLLRHWLGHSSGRNVQLLREKLRAHGLTPVEAASVLQLLVGFSHEDEARPELYELLLEYLSSDRPGLRGLAYWHLYRLAPEGRDFGYDPLAPAAKREPAVRKWKQLIPAGKLPPGPRPDKP